MKSLHLRLRHVAVLSAAAAMAFAVTGLAAATTTVIQNGTFFLTGASGPYMGSYHTVCATRSASGSITGWTVTSGSVDVIGTFWTNETSSTNSLDMNGTPSNCGSVSGTSQAAGTISQTFSTTLDATYVVQFYLAGNVDNSPTTKILDVNATNATTSTTGVYHFTDSGYTTTSMGWTQESYTFVATGSTSTLTFASGLITTGTYGGAAIDNVTVTQTLATGAQCKKGGWQSMYNSTGNLFKNQGACVSYFATTGDVPIGS